MLATIQASMSTYSSGLKCWAAFNDALGRRQHFPATETMALQFGAVFRNGSTYEKYLQHVAWAHRFLRLPTDWFTASVKQAIRGAKRTPGVVREKLAIHSKDAQPLIKESVRLGHHDMAALMAIARLFLLRVPSEGVPLEWDGDHSWVSLSPQQATITLARRKNSRVPVTLTRKCCCAVSGVDFCAVHWLLMLRSANPEHDGRVVDFTSAAFTKQHRACAARLAMTS